MVKNHCFPCFCRGFFLRKLVALNDSAGKLEKARRYYFPADIILHGIISPFTTKHFKNKESYKIINLMLDFFNKKEICALP